MRIRSILIAASTTLAACSPGIIHDPGTDSATPQDAVARDVPTTDVALIDAARIDAPMGSDVPLSTDTPHVDAGRDTFVGSPDTGVACTTGCPANAHCVGTSCECDPYFVSMSGACMGIVPGDPTTHASSDVCAQWAEGHRTTAAQAYVPGATMCDPGSMSRDAINDALRRLNMYRWLVGLTPVTDDATQDMTDQACSLMEHVKGWPGAGNPDPHHPDSSWPCYTANGTMGANSSNISWGTSSAADAMDNWMGDSGNDTTLGHRRWILHPPLGPVGIGFVGDASCLGVFGSGGGGTAGPWYAYPPPGPVPTSITTNAWSFHTSHLNIGSAAVSIMRMSDGMNMPVRMLTLSQGYGDDTVGWYPSGWVAMAGESYQVQVSGLSGGTSATVSYVVQVISCP